MPLNWLPGTSPQPLPREVDNFYGGRKFPFDVPLFIYLPFFPPKLLLGRFYLGVTASHGTLYQPLTAIEPVS